METFVLIHGAYHGSWCWRKVVPLLESLGHKVIAPDLPGHGNDKTPINDITMQSYTDCVCKILDAESKPVILLGHSMGGCIISQVVEYRTDKVKELVYLAAYMLENNESLFQAIMQDPGSELLQNLVVSEDQTFSTVKDESIADIFYGDCSETDIISAKSLLVPQASVPIGTPVNVSNEKFGKIPKTYIECLDDKIISPPFQKNMYSKFDCRNVFSLNSSHSSFLSIPEELVAYLKKLAE